LSYGVLACGRLAGRGESAADDDPEPPGRGFAFAPPRASVMPADLGLLLALPESAAPCGPTALAARRPPGPGPEECSFSYMTSSGRLFVPFLFNFCLPALRNNGRGPPRPC